MTFVLAIAAAACGERAPVAGDPCSSSPGVDSCFDPTHLLTCRAFRWHLDPCRGPKGCASGVCDRAIAAKDDSCSEIGSRACSMEGSALLRCDGYRMVPIDTCRGERGCSRESPHGEPLCHRGAPQIGDECVPRGGSRCGADGKSVLQCSTSTQRMVLERTCRGPRGCFEGKDRDGASGPPDPGMLACDRSVGDVGDPCVGGPVGAFSADGMRLLECKDRRLVPGKECSCIGTWDGNIEDLAQWLDFDRALSRCPCLRVWNGSNGYVVYEPNLFYLAVYRARAEP